MKTRRRLAPEERAWREVKRKWPAVVKKTLRLPLDRLPMENHSQLGVLVTKVFQAVTGHDRRTIHSSTEIFHYRPTIRDFITRCRIQPNGSIECRILWVGQVVITKVDHALKIGPGVSLKQLIWATDTSQID